MACRLDRPAFPAAAGGRDTALLGDVRKCNSPGEPGARRLLVRTNRRGDGRYRNRYAMVSIGGAAPVAFYGQLSHAQLRPNQPLPLPADPEVSAADAQQFQDHELVRAIRLLTMAGERERQRAFVLRLAELSETGAWKDMTASLAHEIDRPDLAVAVARQSIRAGTPLVRNAPVLSITEAGAEPYAVEMPLVHAIVRQESSFDVRAVSPAGAQGLMQLMPGPPAAWPARWLCPARRTDQ